jgi:tRNA threonylcarbamoyladenosine biosynthesis protein TsaB
MWVLALDTTTRDGSAALLRDDIVVVERAGAAGGHHAERLPHLLADVLASAGLGPAAVDLVAVASGPGAFTGLRIGLATMQGLALALGRPAVGVPSLAALAWRHLDAHRDAHAAGAWIEASRGEVFSAAYRRPESAASWPPVEIAPPMSATPTDTVNGWRGLTPGGMCVVGADAPELGALLAGAGLQSTGIGPILATALGRIGWRLHLAGESGPPHALAPVYVWRPDVEIERDRRQSLAAPPR